MNHSTRAVHAINLALAGAVLGLVASLAAAQQPAVDPRIGMGGFKPERMQSQALAPHPSKMTVTLQ